MQPCGFSHQHSWEWRALINTRHRSPRHGAGSHHSSVLPCCHHPGCSILSSSQLWPPSCPSLRSQGWPDPREPRLGTSRSWCPPAVPHRSCSASSRGSADATFVPSPLPSLPGARCPRRWLCPGAGAPPQFPAAPRYRRGGARRRRGALGLEEVNPCPGGLKPRSFMGCLIKLVPPGRPRLRELPGRAEPPVPRSRRAMEPPGPAGAPGRPWDEAKAFYDNLAPKKKPKSVRAPEVPRSVPRPISCGCPGALQVLSSPARSPGCLILSGVPYGTSPGCLWVLSGVPLGAPFPPRVLGSSQSLSMFPVSSRLCGVPPWCLWCFFDPLCLHPGP